MESGHAEQTCGINLIFKVSRSFRSSGDTPTGNTPYGKDISLLLTHESSGLLGRATAPPFLASIIASKTDWK